MAWSRGHFGAVAGENVMIFGDQASMAGRIPVVFCHPVGAGADYTRSVLENTMLCTIADNEVPVIASDGGSTVGGVNFGNAAFVTSTDALIAWAGANLGTRTDKVILFGESMGGGSALTWAGQGANAAKVAGMILREPLVSLEHCYADNANFQAFMDLAYTDHNGFLAALPTRDPLVLAAAGKYAGLDIAMWYGLSDAVLRPADSLEFGRLAGVTPIGTPGGHGVSTFNVTPQMVLDRIAHMAPGP